MLSSKIISTSRKHNRLATPLSLGEGLGERYSLSLLLLFLLLTGVGMSLRAENYPYRDDFQWSAQPNHADWLYQTGERASVEISLCRYGVPVNATIDYEIADDLAKADRQGRVTLKGGRATIDMGTSKTPGFRDLRLTANVDGTTTKHHVKVGFSVERIVPAVSEPSDFEQYWSQAVQELRAQQLGVSAEEILEYSTERMSCQLLRLQTDRQHCVFAYLFIPRDARKGSCPAVLCPPGAGVKTIKDPLRHRYYGEGGCIRMEMEIHGLDPRLSESQFKDISNAFNTVAGGYLGTGLDQRDNYYMRHVYLALVRCLDYLAAMPEWDGRNLIVQGGSQGGALSIVAAALDRRVSACVVNHPALADMARPMTSGYPHFKSLTDAQKETLRYYDVVNFARHLTCPVRMTWGFNDNTCPPTTSYAVWNVITAPKESLITPVNEHWTSEATERAHYEWIMKTLR